MGKRTITINEDTWHALMEIKLATNQKSHNTTIANLIKKHYLNTNKENLTLENDDSALLNENIIINKYNKDQI